MTTTDAYMIATMVILAPHLPSYGAVAVATMLTAFAMAGFFLRGAA